MVVAGAVAALAIYTWGESSDDDGGGGLTRALAYGRVLETRACENAPRCTTYVRRVDNDLWHVTIDDQYCFLIDLRRFDVTVDNDRYSGVMRARCVQ